MGNKNVRKRRKRKSNLFVGICGAALVILVIILGILVWQLVRVQRGEVVGFNLPWGKQPGMVSEQTKEETTAATVSTELPAESGSSAEEESAGIPAVSGDAQAAASPTAMVPQTYANDENGRLIIPARQPGYMETEPDWKSVIGITGDSVLDTANTLAAMYDYDGAIAAIQASAGYESNQTYADAVADYEQRKSEAVQYADNSTIPHIFFHSLVVDTSRAFDESIAISPDDGTVKVADYNYVMTTVDEFCRILEQMYLNDYVLVSIYDVASYETQADGTQVMKHQPIYLPQGKKPFVLSVDDVSYYQYMMNRQGFASRLIVTEDGGITNEYEMPDGSIVRGSYDVVPILDDFIRTHPDFSYRGAKGIIALTGYNGIFGYRTSDFWYNWNCDYFTYDSEKNVKQRETMYYNNENIEQDKATAMAVADALKKDGWLFASHTWGHNKVGDSHTYEFIEWDTQMWEREVEPLIGDTDIIIFPQGEDLYEGSWRGYDPANGKYQLLKAAGFDYFCSVDSNLGWTQLGSDYFRMGRGNVDGQRMWEALCYYADPESGAKDRLSTLFDTRLVFDWTRPTPVTK